MRFADWPIDRRKTVVISAYDNGAVNGVFSWLTDGAMEQKNFLINLTITFSNGWTMPNIMSKAGGAILEYGLAEVGYSQIWHLDTIPVASEGRMY